MGIKGAIAKAAEVTRASPIEIGLLLVMSMVVVGGGAFAVTRSQVPPAIVEEVTPQAEEEPVMLFLHVAGAVAKPGVYEIADGSRITDAIEQAGGAGSDADLDRMNLAEKVSDGQKIYVPRQGESLPSEQGGNASSSGKINLNLATASELESLPGVGPVLAQRIVDHRDDKGGFTSIQQLMEVSGIGPKKFESIKDLVVV